MARHNIDGDLKHADWPKNLADVAASYPPGTDVKKALEAEGLDLSGLVVGERKKAGKPGV